jgi:hypothetical protein
MNWMRMTTLLIAGITFIVFDELVKSFDEASKSINQQRGSVTKRLTFSRLKRQAITN